MSDARTFTATRLFNLRKRAIKLYQEGVSTAQIAKRLELSYGATKTTLQRYQEGGLDALRPQQRGRKKGTGRIFTPEQELQIRSLLYAQKPYQLGITDPTQDTKVRLWTRARVQEFLVTQLGMSLSSALLSHYLDQWGLRLPDKSCPPIQRCSPEIQQWFEETPVERFFAEFYPDRMYWIVANRIENPLPVPRYGGRISKRLTLVTALDGRNKEFWCVYPGNFTKERQIGFINLLLQQSRQKIMIVRSHWNLFTHPKVERYEASRPKRFELLPPLQGKERMLLTQQQEDIEHRKRQRQRQIKTAAQLSQSDDDATHTSGKTPTRKKTGKTGETGFLKRFKGLQNQL